MPVEQPALPLSETLLKSARYYAAKGGQPGLVTQGKFETESVAIAKMLGQTDSDFKKREYLSLLCFAAILGKDMQTKKGDLAAAEFLFAKAAAAQALCISNNFQAIDINPEEMKALLDKSGFWEYFEPKNTTTTDPHANQFSEPTQTK